MVKCSLQSRVAYINFRTPFRAAYNRVNTLSGKSEQPAQPSWCGSPEARAPM